MRRILVIEDNPDLAYGLKNNLEIEGYSVEVAGDGSRGLERALAGRPDLVLLDLMLPELDGFRVVKELAARGSTVPVLVLTARGEEADKVRALKLGADDYVTKPFGLLELLARVESVLRRAGIRDDGRTAPLSERFGSIELDERARTVFRGGERVDLAPREFDLLCALVRRRGAVASRTELLTEVWGYSAEVLTRTIDTHIAELRRKLEEYPPRPRHILTVRKTGYRWAQGE